MLRSLFCRKVAYEPGRTPTPKFLSRRAHVVKGGVNQVLWAEQFWNGHPLKLDREMLVVCPSAKIGPLENFPLYGMAELSKLITSSRIITQIIVERWKELSITTNIIK